MIKFNYVKILTTFFKKGSKTLSLNKIYSKYDDAKNNELKQQKFLKKEYKHSLGYKIALIEIEKAIVEIAREKGDIPKGMSYDDAREKIMMKEYDFAEVVGKAEEYEKEAQDRFAQMETLRKENPREYNEYRYLSLGKIADGQEIDDAYAILLTTLDKQADEMLGKSEPDIEQVIQLNAIYKNIVAAYDRISNKAKKREIDEMLLSQFNSDASALYVPNNFAEITYIPQVAINSKKGTPNNYTRFNMTNSFGDRVEITRVAEVGFGRFRQKSGKMTYREYSTLGEYKITKKYSDPVIEGKRKALIPKVGGNNGKQKGRTAKGLIHYWDEEQGAEVFIVCADLRERILFDRTQDEGARRFTVDVLLSNNNLDKSLKTNGGYIGDICFDKRFSEYNVSFDRDKLCLAKELESARKTMAIGEIPVLIDLEKGTIREATEKGKVVPINSQPDFKIAEREDR